MRHHPEWVRHKPGIAALLHGISPGAETVATSGMFRLALLSVEALSLLTPGRVADERAASSRMPSPARTVSQWHSPACGRLQVDRRGGAADVHDYHHERQPDDCGSFMTECR